jgi:hypothetical protein
MGNEPVKVSFMCPKEMYETILGISRMQDRPLSSMLRVLLEEGLEMWTD